MAKTTTDRAKPWSKRTAVGTAFLLLLLAAAAWWFDAYLLLRLRMIADEAFAGGRETPAMTADAVSELGAYPPKRIVRGLRMPSAQVREIVCLALVHRRGPYAPGVWDGVLPALLDAFRSSATRELKLRSWQAMGAVPEIRPGDVEPIFRFVDAQLAAEDRWWEVCAYLLAAVILDQPEHRPRALERFARSLAVTDATEQQDTLRRLGEAAHDSPEAAAVVRSLTSQADPRWWVLFRTIVERQPTLVDELIGGNATQKRAAFNATFDALGPKSNASWLDADRLKRVQDAARRVLADPAAELRVFSAAARCLSRWPGFAELLFDAAKNSSGRRRAEALTWAYAAAGPEKPSGERFLEQRLPQILAWLDDADPHVRHAVMNVFAPFLSTQRRETDWLKRHRTGVDAPLVAAFRRLLDAYPGRYDSQSLAVLVDAAPALDPQDVDRVAAALEREVQELQTNYDRTQIKPQGRLAPVHLLAFERLAGFSNRPLVQRVVTLRRTLEREGILQPGGRP